MQMACKQAGTFPQRAAHSPAPRFQVANGDLESSGGAVDLALIVHRQAG